MPTLLQGGRKCCGASRVSRMVTNEYSSTPMAPGLTDLSSAAGDAPTGARSTNAGAADGTSKSTRGKSTTGVNRTATPMLTFHDLRRSPKLRLRPLSLPEVLDLEIPVQDLERVRCLLCSVFVTNSTIVLTKIHS